MTPDPILRNMAVVLAAVLLAAGAVGLLVVAVAGAVLNVALWLVLRMPYRSARRRWPIEDAYAAPEYADEAQAIGPALAERARLDRLVDRSVIFATAAGFAGAAVGLAAETDPPGRLAAHALGVAALIGAGGVFWSSLVDWYWTLPRVSGLLGHRSCRAGPEPGAEEQSWEGLTRWWIFHRIGAAVAVAVSAGGIIGTLAGLGAQALDATPAVQGMTFAFTALAASIAEAYRRKATHGASLLLHPEIVVGQAYTDKEAGPCFPVDVAMEGFGVVRRDAQHDRYIAHRTRGDAIWLREKGDETVPLADAQARRGGSADVSCRNECIGLNWYCLRNPNAWDKGVRRVPSAGSDQT